MIPSHRIPVPLDFMEANQIVAALEQRVRTLRSHIEHGVQDDILDAAVAQSERAEAAVRAEFRFPSEAALDGAHEAALAEMAELADASFADVPLALMVDWTEADKRWAWGDR